jgi:hypothetical protein
MSVFGRRGRPQVWSGGRLVLRDTSGDGGARLHTAQEGAGVYDDLALLLLGRGRSRAVELAEVEVGQVCIGGCLGLVGVELVQ